MIEEIKIIIPEAEVQNTVSPQLVIHLPNNYTNEFPTLFKMLEKNRMEFGVKGMGISCTTMEEVFLRYVFDTLILICM